MKNLIGNMFIDLRSCHIPSDIQLENMMCFNSCLLHKSIVAYAQNLVVNCIYNQMKLVTHPSKRRKNKNKLIKHIDILISIKMKLPICYEQRISLFLVTVHQNQALQLSLTGIYYYLNMSLSRHHHKSLRYCFF